MSKLAVITTILWGLIGIIAAPLHHCANNNAAARYKPVSEVRTVSGSINQLSLLTVEILESKQCKRCNELKESSEFTPHPDCRGGLLHHCRKCENEKRQLRYATLTPEQKELKRQQQSASKRHYNQSFRGRVEMALAYLRRFK